MTEADGLQIDEAARQYRKGDRLLHRARVTAFITAWMAVITVVVMMQWFRLDGIKQLQREADRVRAEVDREITLKVDALRSDLEALIELNRGPKGDQGRPPTSRELAAALLKYCAVRNGCRGATGRTGATGADGQDGTDGRNGRNGRDGVSCPSTVTLSIKGNTYTFCTR